MVALILLVGGARHVRDQEVDAPSLFTSTRSSPSRSTACAAPLIDELVKVQSRYCDKFVGRSKVVRHRKIRQPVVVLVPPVGGNGPALRPNPGPSVTFREKVPSLLLWKR